MKRAIEFFIQNNLFADLMTLSVVLVGLWSLISIRRETFPNVKFDVIMVTTLYPGGTPEEVEKLITNPIEQELREVDGIKKMQSVSLEGMSEIILTLDPDQTTEQEAKSDIQDVIDKITDLPEDAEEPKVKSLESKTEPIIEVALYGDVPELEMRRIAKQVELSLETVSGVAKVTLRGERDVEIRVEADQNKLERYRVSLGEVVKAIRNQNFSIPSGSLEQKDREEVVRVVGDYQALADIENTIVRSNELAQPIRVKDLATVKYELEKAQVINRVNGVNSVSLAVAKKEKGDAISVVDTVKAKMEEIMPTLDSRLKLEYVNDFSYYIRNRLSIVTGNLLIGLVCILIILPLLLPMRFAFLAGLSLPFAFFGAILLLYFTGQSINLISMMGLIIVCGMLVDDSIVVTENAVSRMEKGEDNKGAALNGVLQVMRPLNAAVFTTMIVFIPMANMSGIFGKFVVQIPIAVLTCLAVSLFEAYFVLPSHLTHWIGSRQASPKGSNIFTRLSGASMAYWDRVVTPAYVRTLRTMFRHRTRALAGIFGFFILSAVVGKVYVAKNFVLFPPEGIEIFFIRTEAPTGTPLAAHDVLLRPIEKLVGQLPKEEMINFLTTVGLQQQDSHDPSGRRGSEFAQIAVFLTPENKRDRTAREIIEDLRSRVGSPQGLKKVTFDRVNPGPPTGKAVSLGVRGREFSDILPAVNEIKDRLSKVPGVTDLADSHVLGKEEILVKVKGEKASAAGISVADIGLTVRTALEGTIASSIKTLDEEQEVRVSLQEGQRNDSALLPRLLVPNALGNLIPLAHVGDYERGQGPLMIQHEANQRQVSVTSGVDNKVTTSFAVNAQAKEWLKELNARFPKVQVAFGGEDEDTNESLASLMRAFLLALMGVYLILVLTFGNIYQPLTILVTIPLGVVSVLWAFVIHGLPVSFMGLLGTVALVGVIVNNAILFVDFMNEHRAGGKSIDEAILAAAQDRLRPIFLTTVTTVLGLLPTAYGIGGLDKFIVPIAMSLGWGLMFGSVLTVFVFPPTLSAVENFRARLRGTPGAEKFTSSEY